MALDGQGCIKLLDSPSLQSTAIELGKCDPTSALLPLSVRHERGEGWGEGKVNKDEPPLPDPLLHPMEEGGIKELGAALPR